MENLEEKSQTKIISRRDFLKLSGMAIAGVTFIKLPFGQLLRIGPGADKWNPDVEKTVATTCRLCPGACGINVRIIDEFPVSVSGNPFHPVNSGKLCSKGLSLLQTYYHPSRIEQPLIKKDGKFVPISWEEAYQLIADELIKIRNTAEPQKLVFLYRGLDGLSKIQAEKFTSLYGTPNFISLDENEPIKLANYFNFGSFQNFSYDIAKTDMILSFGARLLDGGASPVYTQKVIADMRENNASGILVQVESRCSTASARANEWISVTPGTEGIFALGIAYVMIKERLYDAFFIDKYTSGFEGFEEIVLENYPPRKISEITGISIEKIIRIAKTFASKEKAVAVIDHPLAWYTNGVFNVMAVNALNALKGNIEREGGVLKQRKLVYNSSKNAEPDNTALKGLSAKRIDGCVLDEKSGVHINPDDDEFGFDYGGYPVEFLFIYNCNPVYSLPLSERTVQWMKRIPFTVCVSNQWNETAENSTVILPEDHFLERWQDVPAEETIPYPVVGLSQPVVKNKMYNTKSFFEILSGITDKMGGIFKEDIYISDNSKYIKKYFEDIYLSKRGTVFTDEFNSAQIKVLEERGWWSNPYNSFEGFWNDLNNKGGWWDPAYTFGEWGRVLTTQSGKYEFIPYHLNKILKKFNKNLPFSSLVKSAFSSEAKNYPFYLNVYEPVSYSAGSGGDIPWLLENPTAPVSAFWETWAEINPESAIKLGIGNGDNIMIESPLGKIKAVARYFAAAPPDIISVPAGLGRKSFHKDIPSVGSNIMNIVFPMRENISGAHALLTTMVKIYKI